MNNDLLKQVIKESGLKLTYLAKKVGITRQSLSMKVNGERKFDQGELIALKTNLHLSNEQFIAIFFNDNVDKLPTKQGTMS